MLPPDPTARERMLWAAIAAIVGIVQDGPLISDRRKFQRIEAAAQAFEVPEERFDTLAKRFDFHYYRRWDCYLGSIQLAEANRIETSLSPHQ